MHRDCRLTCNVTWPKLKCKCSWFPYRCTRIFKMYLSWNWALEYQEVILWTVNPLFSMFAPYGYSVLNKRCELKNYKIQMWKQILCSQLEARLLQRPSLSPVSTNFNGTVWWSLCAWNSSNCCAFPVLNLCFTLDVLYRALLRLSEAIFMLFLCLFTF